MKLKNKVISAMKDARVYGFPGYEVVFVNASDRPKLNNPRAVFAVKRIDGKGTPFPVKAEDLTSCEPYSMEDLLNKEQKPAQDQQTLFG